MLQFAIGAIAAPIVGAFGVTTALPMAVVIATLSVSSLLAFALLVRGKESFVKEADTQIER